MNRRQDVLRQVADLLLQAPARHPLRVAVDGITAAGKTTFARELVAEILARGRPCIGVSMDGFHQLRAVRHRRGRASAEGYYEDAYDFTALRTALLDPLGPGGDGRYRTAIIDLAADQPVNAAVQVAPPDLIVIVDGSFLQRRELSRGWDVVVYLRATFEAARLRGAVRDAEQLGSIDAAVELYETRYHAAQRRYLAEVDPERVADIIVDNENPHAPVIARIADDVTTRQPHLRRTRSFFAPRAADWDERFPDDQPAYADAIRALAPKTGSIVVDLGCGTGRALPLLRRAVGAEGCVIGIDATPEMLHVAQSKHRQHESALVLADVTSTPLAGNSIDAILAAGILTHVPAPTTVLRSLADIAKPGGRLALFHPVGRAALARRHRRELRPDELLDPSVLPDALGTEGWTLDYLDDGVDRYLALATRNT